MKKNGFSIPELLAVIVITGILITIAAASYNGISNSLKDKTYNNKLSLIKTKAIEYATDYGVDATTISVAKLIEEGYLELENDTESNERLNNPLGGYLDCYQVDINRELDDYEVTINPSENCSLAETDILASNLEVSVYDATDGLLINQNFLGTNKDIKWSAHDVYLYLNPKSLDTLLEHDMSVTWSINGSNETYNGVMRDKDTNPKVDSSYVNIFKVTTSYLLDTIVTVKVQTSKGLLSKSVNVKIDKETPTLTLDTNASYEASGKVITFNGSDGSGSGFDNYAYALEEKETDNPNFKIESQNNTKEVFENKTYYAYAKDAVGNVSKVVPISITGIDMTKPVCKNPVDNSGWSTSYMYTYGCKSDVGSGCQTPDKTEIQNAQTEYKQVNWTVKDNIGNESVCSYNLAVHVDTTNPTCSIEAYGRKNSSSNKWFIDDVSLYLTVNDEISGVAEYGITTSNVATYNNQKQAILITDTEEQGITYYGYVLDKAGNTGTCSIVVHRLKEQPTCNLTVDNNPDGENGWYKSAAVTVKLNSTSKYVTNKNVNNTNKDSYTINYDTTGTKITGQVTNIAGSVGTCKNSITVKRDTVAPNCEVAPDRSPDGLNNWYISDVKVSLASSDSGSGIASYGLNAYSEKLNSKSSQNLTFNTNNTTYYGVVKDNAGNVSHCKTASYLKLDKTVPDIYLSASDNISNNSWHKDNFDLTTIVNNLDKAVSGLVYRLDNNNNPSVDRKKLNINSNTSGTRYYAKVCTNAGKCSTTDYLVKLDKEDPNVSTRKPGYITLGQNHEVSSDYNASFGISGGSVSCSFTNTNSLGLGVNTAYCTATSGAGREKMFSIEYHHKYSATTNCSGGRYESNGNCYYTYYNDESMCGCNTYNSCRDSSCGIESYNVCENSSCGIASYNSCENSSCGIASYNSCETSSCGIRNYRSCEDPSCGVASYNYCTDPACGSSDNYCSTAACGYNYCNERQSYSCDSSSCELYYCDDGNGSSHTSSTDTGGCSCEKYRQTTCYRDNWGYHSSCGYSSCYSSDCGTTTNSCETSGCGVRSYNSCRVSSCGVESYNSCENSVCGIKSYNSCETPSCGIKNYRSCETAACGIASYNSCETYACGCAIGNTCTLNENAYRFYTCNSRGNNNTNGTLSGTTCYF